MSIGNAFEHVFIVYRKSSGSPGNDIKFPVKTVSIFVVSFDVDYSANDYIITTRKSRNKNTTHLTRYFNKDLPYTAASDLLKNFF